jgi:dihydrofolate synthase / folylpolyglutamate synthase
MAPPTSSRIVDLVAVELLRRAKHATRCGHKITMNLGRRRFVHSPRCLHRPCDPTQKSPKQPFVATKPPALDLHVFLPCIALMEPSAGNQPSPRSVSLAPEISTSSSDYERAIAYLYGRINYERTAETLPYAFRLRRMTELLDRLDLRGVAGATVPVVHVAGTKGKGSTSTMVASMLTAAGYCTGLYTSPHLVRLEERFTVDGKLCDLPTAVALIEALRSEADHMATTDMGPPTFFEMTTAMALMHFRNSKCNAVVLEVGLGGKLDSTNVCKPAATAITSIGYDHQHILGNTLAEIAAQKAGIIKPGVPVVSGVLQAEARQVIETIASENSSPLFAINRDFEVHATAHVCDDWTTKFDLVAHKSPLQDRQNWRVPLDGEHQAKNAAVACALIDLLVAQGMSISRECQASGLAKTTIAGRVERFKLSEDTDLILDTAHNVDSIEALCRCIERRSAGRPVTIVFGTSKDKEHVPMLAKLAEQADAMILTRYHANPRFREPSELLRDLPADKNLRNFSAQIIEEPVAAVQAAISRVSGPQLIVVCGSFFLAAEVRPFLEARG